MLELALLGVEAGVNYSSKPKPELIFTMKKSKVAEKVIEFVKKKASEMNLAVELSENNNNFVIKISK